MPGLRVLSLSAAGQMGGAERSLYELALALRAEDVALHLCCPPATELERLARAADLAVHPVPLRRFRRTLNPVSALGQTRMLFRSSAQIQEIVERERIQVLHANSDSAALIAWDVSRAAGRPYVWHARDLRPLGPLGRVLGRGAGLAVAISRAVEAHLLAAGLPRGKVRLVLNGIDLAHSYGPDSRAMVRAAKRRELRLGADEPVLFDVGAWVPWKKHELFLEALALVRRQMPRAVGLLAGSDLLGQNAGYVEFLEDCLRATQFLEGGVVTVGQRGDVPELLAACDLLVSPSEGEPFGRVLVEAAAAGVPVVATRSGGKPEIVLDGETGLLTPPGDPEALAQACLELLSDPARRARLGARAREVALERFDVRRAAREVAGIFRSLVPAAGAVR